MNRLLNLTYKNIGKQHASGILIIVILTAITASLIQEVYIATWQQQKLISLEKQRREYIKIRDNLINKFIIQLSDIQALNDLPKTMNISSHGLLNARLIMNTETYRVYRLDIDINNKIDYQIKQKYPEHSNYQDYSKLHIYIAVCEDKKLFIKYISNFITI